MRIGLIGVGVVGGTLKLWLEKNTKHELRLYDPGKELLDDLTRCDCIFISVPVPTDGYGQNQNILEEAVHRAKKFTDQVFIRSTVLPGTNDRLKTISAPEFLTERKAFMDMNAHPVLLSNECHPKTAQALFPGKRIIQMSNKECELAKLAHNCFGAMKVTYFNAITELCERFDLNYKKVLLGAQLTGFIEPQHTQVPGPDGLYGYGGKCFPENMAAMERWLSCLEGFQQESHLFEVIENLNHKYRGKIV